MKDTGKLLREAVRGLVAEDLKNLGVPHDATVGGSAALRKMHDAPGVLEAIASVTEPRELAHVIEALIDASGVVRRDEVLRAPGTVQRHEKKTHRR